MATHGRTRQIVIGALEQRKPFKTSGSLTGIDGASGGTGRMPHDIAKEYERDRDKITYTVMSYGTPIAWVLTDGTVKIPDVGYSRTTTIQQGLCRTHL